VNKKRKDNKIQEIKLIFLLFLTLLIIALIIFSLYLLKLSNTNYNYNSSEIYVSEIIDGDTFQLSSGEIVRLICINAPEKGKEGYEEAKLYLNYLVFNQPVILESDQTDKDDYGRLLRYVYLNDENKTFINRILVQEGYAKVYKYGNDTMRCDQIEN